MQNLVVFRHGHTENDSRDILETMNPFFSLGTLATNVKQSVKKKKVKFKKGQTCIDFFQTDLKVLKSGTYKCQFSIDLGIEKKNLSWN